MAVDSLDDGFGENAGRCRKCDGEGIVLEGGEALSFIEAEARLNCGDAATGWRESSCGEDTGEVAEDANVVVAIGRF